MSDIIKKEYYSPIRANWITQSGLEEADFQREISFVIQHIQKNPALKKCDPKSFLKAVMNIAQVGLSLNPVSKYAYLVPRWNNSADISEACLEPGYQGLHKLLTDCGTVKSLTCQVIWQGDKINIDLASHEKVKEHIPYWIEGKQKGSIRGVYSVAKLPDDSFHAETMSYADICDIKDRSESYKSYVAKKTSTCIWVTDEAEMCRKTVIKRHYKYLPKSANAYRLEQAIELDNQVNGFDEPIDYGLSAMIETLIQQATLNGHEKSAYTDRLCKLKTKSEAFQMIDELKEYAPIMGLHDIPQNVEQQGEAIKYAVGKDDFHDERKNKSV